MNLSLHDILVQHIKDALAQCAVSNADEVEVCLDLPTDNRFGDLSTAVAMRLGKLMKTNPRLLADRVVVCLKASLPDSEAGEWIKEIKVEGAGFINFYLQERFFYRRLGEVLQKGSDAFRSSIGAGRKVLIEFVSANPTGPLSVAHARQAAVGDSLANILAFLGFSVSREYYLNDEGNQITILGNSVKARQQELEGQQVDFPENYYQGDYIYEIAKTFSVQPAGTEPGEYAAAHICDIIRKELDDFDVHFDCWYSQKELGKSGKVEQALADLRTQGHVFDADGAVWFRSTAFGDDKDRVVIKSDGSYTYLAPDIAYHREKYRRGFEWLINLWGPDHHGYINRVRAAVEASGQRRDSLSVVIVQLASIYRDGKIVEMSTRKGQYITLREVLDEVGRDAARYFFLMRRTSSLLDFDLEVAKKESSDNPVYYVQYAHARICSILRNSDISIEGATDLHRLTQPEEIALIKKVLQLPYILDVCLYTRDPYMITVYLQELSEVFHKFYDSHRVLGEDPELSRARLALIQTVKITLATGLELLGVSRPEQM